MVEKTARDPDERCLTGDFFSRSDGLWDERDARIIQIRAIVPLKINAKNVAIAVSKIRSKKKAASRQPKTAPAMFPP